MIRVACFLMAGILSASPVVGAALPPIQTVEIRDRALHVNGEPFLPIMIWLQDAENFPAARDCNMNTVAGYWPKSSGTKDVTEYLALVREAGLYGVMPFHEGLKGRPAFLGYIHGDEPDLPHRVSDAEIVPADHLRINRKTPLWKLVDGVTHSWSVLDPMKGAEVTIKPKQPVTAVRLAVHLTVSKGLAVAKEIVFEADGKPVLEATLEKKKGRQALDLPGPVRFKALTLKVRSAYPGENVWGSVGEVEAFNAAGENVLLAPPRLEPRTEPDVVQKEYEAIKAHDPSRPVFMTVTGNFHPHFEKWSDARRKRLYPAYVRAADVVGYDIYPIYGWNKPEWIHLVHDATERLAAMAGDRPVYAWIETSRGGQWTGDLARQKQVTPRHIRAEVWMALTGGATAIGYFTHTWKPSYKQFGVPEANRKALARINARLARLAPAILGKRVAGKATPAEKDVKVDAVFRESGGARYVFAVNYDERLKGTDVTFEAAGLADGAAVEVIDEDRTLRARAGGFTDRFDPLAVHLYRVKR